MNHFFYTAYNSIPDTFYRCDIVFEVISELLFCTFFTLVYGILAGRIRNLVRIAWVLVWPRCNLFHLHLWAVRVQRPLIERLRRQIEIFRRYRFFCRFGYRFFRNRRFFLLWQGNFATMRFLCASRCERSQKQHQKQ